MDKDLIKNIKLIVCDLDGTAIDNEHTLSQTNIKAIQKIIKKGYRFIFATGRDIERCLPILKQINPKYDDYVICLNGAGLYSIKNQNYVFHNAISQEAANLIFQQADLLDLEIFTYNANNTKNHYTGQKRELIYSVISKITTNKIFYSDKRPRDLIIYKFILHGEEKNYQKLFKILEEHNLTYFEFVYDNFRNYEISPPNSNKLNALKFLAKILNLEARNILGMGDNKNDLDIVKWSGIGIWFGKTEILNYPNVLNLKSNPNRNLKKLWDFLNK